MATGIRFTVSGVWESEVREALSAITSKMERVEEPSAPNICYFDYKNIPGEQIEALLGAFNGLAPHIQAANRADYLT